MTDTFLVFEADAPMEAAMCLGLAEAAKVARDIGWNNPALRVWRITLDEICRDVTDDFIEVNYDEL